MPSATLLAQMNAFDLRSEHVTAYVFITLGFLVLAWIIKKWTHPLGTCLILWGILVTILSCGYGLIGVPTVMMLAPALAKIGFLLVLGGVAWSLLAVCAHSTATKEADHV